MVEGSNQNNQNQQKAEEHPQHIEGETEEQKQ